VIDLLLERDASALIQGTVLVDPNDRDTTPRVLVYLEHSIVGGRASVGGGERLVSKRFCFVETDEALGPRDAGPAPFLDYRAPTPEELAAVAPLRDEEWIRADLDHEVLGFAIAEVVPGHIDEVSRRTNDRIDRTVAAVRARLLGEIAYWDHRANTLQEQEEAGRPRGGAARARRTADELEQRLDRRLTDLEAERRVSPRPPVVTGGALVVPQGHLDALAKGERDSGEDALQRARTAALAVGAVMEVEHALGRQPTE